MAAHPVAKAEFERIIQSCNSNQCHIENASILTIAVVSYRILAVTGDEEWCQARLLSFQDQSSRQ